MLKIECIYNGQVGMFVAGLVEIDSVVFYLALLTHRHTFSKNNIFSSENLKLRVLLNLKIVYHIQYFVYTMFSRQYEK